MNSPERDRQVRQLSDNLYHHMRRFGYEAVELPIIEAADLFLIKAGDQVLNKLFTFERHGQQLALRPEFTAPAAYRYLHTDHPSVTRWQFSGVIFEDNPDDAARNYQRFSVGAELTGMAGAAAEAEIISLAAQGITSSGIDCWTVSIGHIKLLRQVLARFGLDSRTERFILHHLPVLRDPLKGKSYILEQLDKLLLGKPAALLEWASDELSQPDAQQMLDALLDTAGNSAMLGARTRQDIARRLLQKRQRAADRDHIVAALETLERWCSVSLPPTEAFTLLYALSDDDSIHQTLAEWQIMVELLGSYDITPDRILIQPGMARSWEYYTGVVFDLVTIDGRLLGGGGRYDELTRLIGGESDVPAVGFAYYMESVLAAMPSTTAPDAGIISITLTPHNQAAAARWAHHLRQLGLAVRQLPVESELPAPLVIDERGYAIFNNRVYTLAEVEPLADELKRAAP